MRTGNMNLLSIKRILITILGAMLLTLASLVALQLQAQARWKAAGAGGCGAFIDALGEAEDGDIIAQMIPEKPTDGAIITKNVVIQGGWFPSIGCDEPNQTYTETQDAISAGFEFQGPFTKSVLTHDLGSVLTIDPSVISLTVQHLELNHEGESTAHGGGITGIISNAATVRLENLLVTGSNVISDGGAIYLEVRGGSRLVISDSEFISNTASTGSGGGLKIHLYENSHLIIHNTEIFSNMSSGSGGGLKILADSGYITITESAFRSNLSGGSNLLAQKSISSGNQLSIEGIGSGSVSVWLNDNMFDGKLKASDTDIDIIGEGIKVSGNNAPLKSIFLPAIMKNAPPSVRITGITLTGNQYAVAFETVGFTPELMADKLHLHFFFNTVLPEDAGSPGAGPWKIYPSSSGGTASSPYTGYGINDKPAAATQLCVLVANPNHSVRLASGNCYSLP